MKLSGKILQDGDTLPMVNVFVSDAEGNFKSGNKGTAGDVDGNYSIDVASTDYVTASFAGAKKTVKASDVCTQNSCNFDFVLGGNTLNEVVITAFKDEDKKPNWKKIALISGISLIGLIAIVYGIKKMKSNK